LNEATLAGYEAKVAESIRWSLRGSPKDDPPKRYQAARTDDDGTVAVYDLSAESDEAVAAFFTLRDASCILAADAAAARVSPDGRSTQK
jgi:hypothetical protein